MAGTRRKVFERVGRRLVRLAKATRGKRMGRGMRKDVRKAKSPVA